jgi:5'-AMP-activated protein kinase catalytic alpha subunit
MLTVDPVRRATIKEIREHEWFQVNLPDYLFPRTCEEGTNIIDLDAIQEVCEVNLIFLFGEFNHIE